jgi:C-terminal processing protease CtpA/Prc
MRSVRLGLILLALVAAPGAGSAQQSGPAPIRDDTPLGIKLAAVPDALYAHLPTLERGQGLLVETIKPGSRAAELGLKAFDIVLSVGTSPVRSGEDLHGKLSTLQPGEREVLQIVRGGKQFALTVATPAENYIPAKSLFKPGGPPAVSIEIKPLKADGAMEVNLFYLNQANKLDRHALHGSLDEIEHQVADLARKGQMPENIRDLVSLALMRLRTKKAP